MKGLLFLAVYVVLSAVCHGASLKVGLVLPLTGDAAFYGKDALAAAQLWQEDNPDADFELVVEDAQLDATQSLLATQKLIQVDKVDVLYSMDANPGRAIKRLATQYEVVHFSQSWDKSIADGYYNIVFNHQPEAYVKCLVDYIEGAGFESVGLLYMQNNAFAITAEEIRRQLAERPGIRIVADSHFSAGVRDFQVELMKLRRKAPDILVILSFPPELEIVAQEIHQMGWNIPLSSVESFDISNQRHLFEGNTYVSAMDMQGGFARRFEEHWGRQTIYPGYIYDILSLLAMSEKDDRNLAKQVLQTAEFNGVVGVASQEGGVFSYRPFLVEMLDGMPVRVE